MESRGIFNRFTSPVAQWTFAIAALATATVINFGYQTLVDGTAFFSPYYPFLVVIALMSGRNPAYASLVGATAIVAVVWMDASANPLFVAEPYRWALVGYLVSGGLMIAVTLRAWAHAQEVERKGAELQTMLDLIPVGVAVAHDPRGDQITVSPNFAAMLGLDSTQNASLSGPGRELIPYRAMREGRELSGDELPMQVASRTGKEVRDFDLELVFGDGRRLEMRISAAPLFDEEGNVRGAIGAHVDLSDLRQATRALVRSSEQKDEFLATLAHELRNPLAPIRYASALLRRDQSRDAVERAGATIDRQAAHMTRLLDDLLDLSRITRNVVTLRKEPVDMQSLVKEVLEATQPYFDKRGQHVTATLAEQPAWVIGDHERLHQVIANLLTNASKYTDANGHVRVSIDQDDEYIRCAVQDDGIGLVPGDTDKIFDLFTQVNRGLDTHEHGLGIGLAVVRRLVDMHGGDITAISDGLGKGSTFTVRLPAAPASFMPGPVVPRVDDIVFERTPLRVLVVDDNRDAADTMAEYLRLHAILVTVAYGGAKAMQLAERTRPDVVLLDIGMPDVDGIAVATWLRSQPWGSAVRLLAVTGWGQPQDRERTTTAGFDLHLTKPVDPGQLMVELRSMLPAERAVEDA